MFELLAKSVLAKSVLAKSVAIERPHHNDGRIKPQTWESRQNSFAARYILGFHAAAAAQGFNLEVTHAPDFTHSHFNPSEYATRAWQVSPFDPNGVTPPLHPHIS
mmetsp:Transcript_51906/g.126579  ORF Transcript_51906/g.126579 Transcript_51906/m.126579 type:complete len:105 (+) Transcript_51906:63-377(+)